MPAAQKMLLELARVNAEASLGEWNEVHITRKIIIIPVLLIIIIIRGNAEASLGGCNEVHMTTIRHSYSYSYCSYYKNT